MKAKGAGRRLDTAEFIRRAKLVHGKKYDYSRVIYVNDYTKVEIVCPKHGSFWQQPSNHVRQKSGCETCSYINRGAGRKILSLRINQQDFVRRAKEIHGDKYNYSKVEYNTADNYVIIICPIHGEFKQKATNHIHLKLGCNKCRKIESRKSLDKFIEDARKSHGDKYDYSKVKYINNKTNVEIICPNHGSFWQKPCNHISNQTGCPMCKESFGERRIAKILKDAKIYFVQRKKFDDLRNENTGKKMHFDFFVPEKGLLIEYDGRQHFDIIEHFGGENRLTKTQQLDKLKNKYAKEKGYKLLRISYFEYGDIENILKREL
jgi:very-short-patch-repair endonuclease